MSYVEYKREFNRRIDEIINAPIKKPTKEEARASLRSLGIIDENDDITPAFQGILFKKAK